MKKDAVILEEERLKGIETIEDYASVHERHRVFPAIFENRQHKKVLDTSAGVGVAAQRIAASYPTDLLCNDISPCCLEILNKLHLPAVSFDLDDTGSHFPFADGYFDAVISLATIEHLLHVDHFVQETYRILDERGYFYISTPNYAALMYLPRFLLTGRTFHDPLRESSRYEFYAHLRYFTYRTLLEFVSSFGFVPDTIYLALPGGSSRYQAMYTNSRLKALSFRSAMKFLYTFFPPRWASEPIICFRKAPSAKNGRIRKVIL
jgi:SAM-dependent methyltransferase